VDSVINTLRRCKIHGLVHITGGGFIDNIPRILPAGCAARLYPNSWPILPSFSYLQKNGNISIDEMYRTFNMGIGMMVIVPENSVEDMLQQFRAHGEQPYLIGEIKAAQGSNGKQVIIDGVC
jgi:phosphoribosylformylglycinamidine cyclo-ligase